VCHLIYLFSFLVIHANMQFFVVLIFFSFFFLVGIFNHVKRIPMGKWQCPTCCQKKNDPLKPISQLDSISKRARTKTVTGKSKTGIQSSDMEKVSRIFGSSIIAKKRSSSKGKSVKLLEKKPVSSQIDVSCSTKPSHRSLALLEGSSSSVNVDDEKKSNLSQMEPPPVDRKSTSPAKEISSHSKVTNSEATDETPKEKPDLSSNDVSPEKQLVLAISAAKMEHRKRKLKVNDGNSEKKRRTDKGKFRVNTSKKRGSKANTSSPGNSKSHQKHKSINNGVSTAMSKEDLGAKNLDLQSKDEVSYIFLRECVYVILWYSVPFQKRLCRYFSFEH
jgi:hypothetical protein